MSPLVTAYVIKDRAERFWGAGGWTPHLSRAIVYGLGCEAAEALRHCASRLPPDVADGCRVAVVAIDADGRTVPTYG